MNTLKGFFFGCDVRLFCCTFSVFDEDFNKVGAANTRKPVHKTNQHTVYTIHRSCFYIPVQQNH